MMDHFQRLGLPRRFSIDESELERAYLAASRAIHPDYHLDGSDAELSASLELSADVNGAYNTLRERFARADYLLNLEGGPAASESKELPKNFLTEMLEAREQLESARGITAEIAALEAKFGKQSAELVASITKLFARYESLGGENPERANLRLQIRGLLNAAKYISGLLRDLHAD